MGWEDRDWAKWTPKERAHFLGSTTGVMPGAFLGIVISFVAVVALGQSARHRPAAPAPIYSDGRIVQVWGKPTTCTQFSYLPSGTVCDVWRILVPNEQALPATPLPAGARCAIAVADQRSHSWVCETSS